MSKVVEFLWSFDCRSLPVSDKKQDVNFRELISLINLYKEDTETQKSCLNHSSDGEHGQGEHEDMVRESMVRENVVKKNMMKKKMGTW